MRTDWQTYKRAEVRRNIVVFRKSANAPKSGPLFCGVLYVLVLVLYKKTVWNFWVVTVF